MKSTFGCQDPLALWLVFLLHFPRFHRHVCFIVWRFMDFIWPLFTPLLAFVAFSTFCWVIANAVMLCAARPSFIHNTYVHIHACAYLYELKLQQCFRTWQHIELESWGGLVPLFIGHEMETLWSTHTQLLVARIGVLLGSVSMTLTHFKSCLQGFVVKF